MATINVTKSKPTLDREGKRALATYRKLRAIMGRPLQVQITPNTSGDLMIVSTPKYVVKAVFLVRGHKVGLKVPVQKGVISASELSKAGVQRGDVLTMIWFVDVNGHPLASAAPYTF